MALPWRRPVFAGPLEREFLEAGERTGLRIARNWLLLTAGTGCAMIWAAPLSGPRMVLAALALQGLGGLPTAIAATLLLPRLPPGWRREALFVVAAAVILACTTAQSWWASPAYADRYVMAGGLILFSVPLVVPLRLPMCAAFGALGLTVLSGMTLLPADPVLRNCADLVAFAALLLSLGLRVRARAERDQRRLFLLHRQDKLQRQALARANERLREMSETDSLTGVANRRRFDAALRRSLEPHAGARPVLLLLDVDHFKALNDTLGHPKGDECLRLVARSLRDHLRNDADIVARIGGEEFAVLLPRGTEAEALEVAERIRVAVEALRLPHPGRPDLPRIVTTSVGAAIAAPRDTADSLLSRADAALYAAKAAGRNGVRLAPVQAEGAVLEHAPWRG